MNDFWKSSGFRLLSRGERGLGVSDGFLRQFLERPELIPDADSCASERQLHARVLDIPASAVTTEELEAVIDNNARENWQVWLNFRDHLLNAPSIETAYLSLFNGSEVRVPSIFINKLVQVILRNILDDSDDALELRAAEMFFRPQKISINDGVVLAADLSLVEGKGMGNLGRWLLDKGAPVRSLSLDVLEESNAQSYFSRDERYDMVLAINGSRPGAHALCRVMEKWLAYFHKVKVTIIPVPEIADEDWVWHVGLDTEATWLLNSLYRGAELEHDDLWRLLALFKLSFSEASDARPELDGRPVYLGLAMSEDGILRLKPQNLLVNLPLARRT
jgi:hypothetical protein